LATLPLFAYDLPFLVGFTAVGLTLAALAMLGLTWRR
jgi:hypothetical protein